MIRYILYILTVLVGIAAGISNFITYKKEIAESLRISKILGTLFTILAFLSLILFILHI